MGSNLIKQNNTRYSLIVRTVLILSTCIGLSSCQSESKPVTEEINKPNPELTKTIVIGDISNNPAKKVARYQPMADYLARNLSELGIGRGEVKVASSLDTMIGWLKSGEVDIYFDSAYPTMIVSDRTGSIPILRRWKGGQAEYYGIFFTMSSRGINTLGELQGKTIAFDEIYSTSGYFLPLVKLVESGLKAVETKPDNGNVLADTINYVFTDDDENTIQWVISGKVDAGVVDIETFEEIPLESRREITLLAKTKTVPRQIASIRQDLDSQLREEIKTILLNMNQTEVGQETLTKFEETSKFDDLPTEQNLQELRKLYELIAEN